MALETGSCYPRLKVYRVITNVATLIFLLFFITIVYDPDYFTSTLILDLHQLSDDDIAGAKDGAKRTDTSR